MISLCLKTNSKTRISSRNNKQNQCADLFQPFLCFQSKTSTHKDINTSGLTLFNKNKGDQLFKSRGAKRTITSPNHTSPQTKQNLVKSIFCPSQNFIKMNKPILENKKMIFYSRKKSDGEEKEVKVLKKQSNIQKLKNQILELDRQDFISYRSKKLYSNTHESHLQKQPSKNQNQKLNQYNHQNSMIVQWKGTNLQRMIRPNSTMGISDTHKSAITGQGLMNNSLAPKKYFSKPKTVRNMVSNEACYVGHNSSLIGNTKMKIKCNQIAIGLNMFRGKFQRKKINSCFKIY